MTPTRRFPDGFTDWWSSDSQAWIASRLPFAGWQGPGFGAKGLGEGRDPRSAVEAAGLARQINGGIEEELGLAAVEGGEGKGADFERAAVGTLVFVRQKMSKLQNHLGVFGEFAGLFGIEVRPQVGVPGFVVGRVGEVIANAGCFVAEHHAPREIVSALSPIDVAGVELVPQGPPKVEDAVDREQEEARTRRPAG